MRTPLWVQILIENHRSRRILVARRRLEVLLNDTPRLWFAARIGGGGAVHFGRVNRRDAEILAAKRGDVQYVDVDAAFIAYSDRKARDDGNPA